MLPSSLLFLVHGVSMDNNLGKVWRRILVLTCPFQLAVLLSHRCVVLLVLVACHCCPVVCRSLEAALVLLVLPFLCSGCCRWYLLPLMSFAS